MAKKKDIYIGKGFTDMFVKGMEERGVAIESVTYPTVEKGTKIHGYETACSIEQNGKVLGSKENSKTASWVEEIEKIAPKIKGSFFGLGAYKNVTITGVSTLGFTATASASAKNANGISCIFRENMSVYITAIDIKKFRKWMAEWGHKFGLKKKGNVWMTKAEWQSFFINALVPFTVETSVKTKRMSSSSSTLTLTKINAKTVYDEVPAMIKGYLSNNLGLSVSIYYK